MALGRMEGGGVNLRLQQHLNSSSWTVSSSRDEEEESPSDESLAGHYRVYPGASSPLAEEGLERLL
jgi:hypothetical protein